MRVPNRIYFKMLDDEFIQVFTVSPIYKHGLMLMYCGPFTRGWFIFGDMLELSDTHYNDYIKTIES